jgi:phage terminase large subunit-like protein
VTPVESPLERLAGLPPVERETVLKVFAQERGVTVEELKATMLNSWRFTGRPKQQAPPGDWLFWWIRSGRGWGKTKSASEWVKDRGLERRCRIGVIAPTLGDVRSTCFEGVTGLLSVIPNDALLGQTRSIGWNKSLLELTLANGTVIKGFSSEEPDRLRGPQHDYVWGEEISSWKDAARGDVLDTAFSNMKLGLRLGPRPRAVLTSTPKANKLTKELAALPAEVVAMVIGSSYENRANLSEVWWSSVVKPLEGTRTGRQEIEAEILEDVEGALWTRTMIDKLRVDVAPPLSRIVVAVDPNTTSGESADNAGIVVAGLGHSDKHGYVLADRTQTRGGPRAWAQAAVDAYYEFEADLIVVEVNNGGEMCELVIHSVDPTVPVKKITASRGKRTRAEPVAALYESDEAHEKVGRVHHVGPAANFAALEDELTTWVAGDASPGRLDAAVWSLTELKLWAAPPVPMRTYVPGRDRKGVEVDIAPDRFGAMGGY